MIDAGAFKYTVNLLVYTPKKIHETLEIVLLLGIMLDTLT